MFNFRAVLLLALLTAVGCDQSPQTPDTAKQSYPGIIRSSPERRERAEREWERLLDAYGAPKSPPDFYPITHTPRSLLKVNGGLKILPNGPAPDASGTELRQQMKVFIDKWQDLLGADTATVSLVSADSTGDATRLTYRQASYPFPVAGAYGEMTAVVSRDGRLLQLDDRFIPVVELPLKPAIERNAAAQGVVGRTFTYSDIAGRPQQVKIGGPEEVSVKRLVVLPIEKGNEIRVHLAWEVMAGQALSWTVYVDAMTGEELRADQNFNT
ncbi:MAG TPA: hypothetical protein VNO70_13430 [Blastocatellia bacterium]|nr:hypothetical protein [Blastocatellia bacterium]